MAKEIVSFSSNEDPFKPLISEILSYFDPEKYEIVFEQRDIGDVQLGNVVLELKLSASDFLLSLIEEGTTSRLMRQALNLSQFPMSEIVVAASFNEVILESRMPRNKPVSMQLTPAEPPKCWSLKSIIGLTASIRTRMGVPITFIGSTALPYYVYDLLVKGNDGKTPIINPLKVAATPNQEQEANLQSIKTIGDVISKNLLTHFGTLKAIYNATPEELMKVDEVGKKKADKIFNLLNRKYDCGDERTESDEDNEPSGTVNS